ncbi:MAG: cytochrome c biogenesis protein CcsA, partial [Planctomycetota bacterium]
MKIHFTGLLLLSIFIGTMLPVTNLPGQNPTVDSENSDDVTVPAPTAEKVLNEVEDIIVQGLDRLPWSKEILQQVAQWPLQHAGRIKPFDTYAGFNMLKIHGKRSLRLDDEKLGPIAWALDCMLYPQLAQDYPCILVTNAEVLTSIGFDITDRKRRDRWSYNDLKPSFDPLFRNAQQVFETKKEAKDWTLIERQTVQLAQNIRALEDFFHAFDTARYVFPLNSIDELTEIFGDSPGPGFSAVLTGLEGLEALASRENLLALPTDRQTVVINGLQQLQSALLQNMQIGDRGIAWFPPEQVQETTENIPVVWTTGSGVFDLALASQPAEKRILALAAMEQLPAVLDDRALFLQKSQEIHTLLSDLATLHGQYNHIAMEVSFYRMDYFYRALICFIFAFLLACLGWLKPETKLPTKGTWLASLLGTGLLVTGIVLRCIIQGRPPVTTLYETILFITACCVITALVMEKYDRRKISLTTATVLGTLGCFLSMRYELKEAVSAGDTMPSLVAVLDTNFWLSTHVTSVTLGYSAGLLAAAISHVWLIGKLFGIRKNDKDFYRSITRMVYGTICFGLFFSIVGTILGGIWANYSWGRFWGWDP